MIILWVLESVSSAGNISEEPINPSIVIGEWVRPDGGYTLTIDNIHDDGTVSAGYFNPSEIDISEGTVSSWKGLIKLYIKLQDKGYPGSTYTLYYYAEKDALAGFYYQATKKQTFEVVFFRKP